MKEYRRGMIGTAMVAMAVALASPMGGIKPRDDRPPESRHATPKRATQKQRPKPTPRRYRRGTYHKIYANPRTPVKNPAQAMQMNKMHVAWATKKFGTCDTSDLYGY